MARADLLCELIKNGLEENKVGFRKVAEAICADERGKQHGILADKIEELLKNSKSISKCGDSFTTPSLMKKTQKESMLFIEKEPKKRLEQLVLPSSVLEACRGLIEEQLRADLLRSYGVEPRSKVLLIGPPGNGKTSLAEAIAESLMLPLYTVRYEGIVGSYLGETASNLAKLFEYIRTRPCVLFFDEFETLGKERGDMRETGEIKRVVSSLLLHIDALPSYVIAIGATNHDNLLDQAAWRRFQIRMELPKPTRANLEKWFSNFEREKGFKLGFETSTLAKKTLGFSYAEVEELALEIYRQYILSLPDANVRIITDRVIKIWNTQKKIRSVYNEEGEV